MKKVFLVLVSLLVFTGCGKEEKMGVINCTYNTKDVVNGYEVSAEYKINYKGDFVESVETTEIYTSKSSDIIEYFEEYLNNTYKQMDKAYGGYTYEITKSKDKVISEVKIDYNKIDLEQFIEDQPTLKNFSKDNKLTVAGIRSIYELMGATCE